MAIDFIAISKTLTHALRHEPWLYEFELDEEEWLLIDDVLDALRAERPTWSNMPQADLAAVIKASSKRRFEIENGRIRALYGHSIPRKMKKSRALPPAVLYHGTAPEAVQHIQKSGLMRMKRQHVHLSVDEGMAAEVGRRKSPSPVILRIDAAEAHADGIGFYEGNEQVWLADLVPAQFITEKART